MPSLKRSCKLSFIIRTMSTGMHGLACDGCTDSVLVVLPSDDSDPVTFSIIEAMRYRKVFGKPKIGDMMAVVVNKDNKRKSCCRAPPYPR